MIVPTDDFRCRGRHSGVRLFDGSAVAVMHNLDITCMGTRAWFGFKLGKWD